jgi:N4-gp56 family major capsid protein
MALTDFASLSALQKKVWSAKVLQAGRHTSFFMGTSGFMGGGTDDATKPIHLVTDLTATEGGDRVVMPLVQDLQGDGVVGDNELEGNEESLVTDSQEIKIDQFRHAVKSKGKMSEQKTVLRFRAQAKDKLGFWLGNKVDELAFLTIAGIAYTSKLDGSLRPASSQLSTLAFAADVTATSTNRKAFAGTATSTATLTTADKMNWDLLVRAKATAVRKVVKPIRINGGSHYVVVMSPEQARDLKTDTTYRTVVQNAGVRGSGNELFTGSFAQIDGLILYEHQKVPTTLAAASGSKYGASGTVDGSQAIFLGAQALGMARIGDAEWNESDMQDYGNREGIAYGRMIGFKKPVYTSNLDGGTSEDFAAMSIYTAAAA